MSEYVTCKPSLGRLFRQICYVPILHNNWVNTEVKSFLSEQVTQAELGHSGEICVVIENNLPIQTAYKQSPRMRAIQVFSNEKVWDTEENTGVLVYINVCEQDLEIVADRGINAHVPEQEWQHLCNEALTGIKEGQHKESLGTLILNIGDILRKFYQLKDDPSGNEISDKVRHFK